MTIEKAKKIRDLLDTKDELLEILEIRTGNYDSKIEAVVSSFHNSNRKSYIERKIELPENIQKQIINYINEQIETIDKEIEKL